jgi:lysophospholipase L1-like esterase
MFCLRPSNTVRQPLYRLAFGFLLIGALLTDPVAAADDPWIATWSASPSDPLPAAKDATPHYANQTVRLIAHISIGGAKVRLRLSNSLGQHPLTVGAVHLRLADRDETVTFSGQRRFVIPNGADYLSDPVDLKLPAGADLAVSLYFPDDTGPVTQHSLGVQTGSVATGDQTGAADLPGAVPILTRPVLSDIEVLGRPGDAAVVTLGDSITDGQHSTVDADRRWPDLLAGRLVARFGDRVGVANAGINGNRLLSESKFGPDALARFDRDVLSKAGVRYVTVLLGINDIGHAPDTPVETSAIIAALKQLADRAHDHGLKIYGATLLPFEASPYWAAEGESMRQAVNGWIRQAGAFDAVLDFDRVTRDPAHPVRLLAAYDSGDHLHPNDAGYAAMAASIDLDLFKGD